MNQSIINELVDGLLNIMEEHLVKIILYGSVARGTNTEESDIDIALLVKEEISGDLEDALSDFIVDMNQKHDRVFSVIDIDYDMFIRWEQSVPFYNNVNQEGLVLWKVA